MTDAELLELNQMGLIPGPGEEEKDFVQRVAKTKERYKDGIPKAHWDWVGVQLEEMFGFRPAFLYAFYSNEI